jgi:hypothetical protein
MKSIVRLGQVKELMPENDVMSQPEKRNAKQFFGAASSRQDVTATASKI